MQFIIAQCLAMLAVGAFLAQAATLNGACSTNADCSVTNSYCMKTYNQCTKGTCVCSSLYQQEGAACKLLKTYDATCDGTTDTCAGGSTCTGSPLKCKCASGFEWNTPLAMCVTTGKKAVSEMCTQESDCYQESGTTMVECVAATGQTQKYCRCKAGYITIAGGCRKPMSGEICTTAVGCEYVRYDANDASQVSATCTSGKCDCGSTAEVFSATIAGTVNSICLSKFTGTLIADGATCTAANSCSSKFCTACPDEGNKKCLTLISNGGHSIQLGSVLMITLVTVFVHLFGQ